MHLRQSSDTDDRGWVEGADLSQPLGDERFQGLHDALKKRSVLFFREQDLDYDAMSERMKGCLTA